MSLQRIPAALLTVLLACSTTEATEKPDVAHEVVGASADGKIRVSEASKAFVRAEEIQASEGGVFIQAPGRVVFLDDAVSRVGVPVHGRVTAVHVREGQRVEAGDLLMTLRSPEASAIRADLQRAQVALRAAEEAFSRQERLAASGVGIAMERSLAEFALLEARSDIDRAQQAVSALGGGTGEVVHLTTSISGTVLSRSASVGASVGPDNDSLFEVGDPSGLQVVVDVFDMDLPGVRLDAPVEVHLATQDAPVTGRVVAVGAAVAQGKRRAPVYVTLDTPVPVAPGTWARTRIQADAADTLQLPVQAILVKERGKHVVYVDTGEGYAEREVSVGTRSDELVQVRSGLSAGERVVVEGALLLDAAGSQLL